MLSEWHLICYVPSTSCQSARTIPVAALKTLPILEYRPAFVTHQTDTTLPRNRARIVR